jgi:phosphatidylinositol glycan class N
MNGDIFLRMHLFFNVYDYWISGMSLILPLLSSHQVLSRLYSVGLSLVVLFLLLSASHEGLFILALTLNMFCWLLLELHTADSCKDKVMM